MSSKPRNSRASESDVRLKKAEQEFVQRETLPKTHRLPMKEFKQLAA